MSVEASAVSFLRRMRMGISKGHVTEVIGVLPIDVANYLQNNKRNELIDVEKRYGTNILIKADHSISPGGGKLDFIKNSSARDAHPVNWAAFIPMGDMETDIKIKTNPIIYIGLALIFLLIIVFLFRKRLAG